MDYRNFNPRNEITMTILEMFKKELDQESKITRKLLERVPDGKYGWQPHPKSMTLQRLSNHLAELPGWIQLILTTTELDFEKNPYQPDDADNTSDLLKFYESCLEAGRAELDNAAEAQLYENWKLRAGDQIFYSTDKWEMIRHTFSQIIHHRAQLGVCFRLLDIPVPSSYGGSADDQSF
jgi:uncharacterized damage-inducible protein DinB